MWPSFSQWIKRTDTTGHFQAWPPQTLSCLTHCVLSFSWPLSGHIRIWKKSGLPDDLLEGCPMIQNTPGGLWVRNDTSTVWNHGTAVGIAYQIQSVIHCWFFILPRFPEMNIMIHILHMGKLEACQEHQGAQLGSSQTEGFHQVWQILYIFTTIKKKNFKKSNEVLILL